MPTDCLQLQLTVHHSEHWFKCSYEHMHSTQGCSRKGPSEIMQDPKKEMVSFLWNNRKLPKSCISAPVCWDDTSAWFRCSPRDVGGKSFLPGRLFRVARDRASLGCWVDTMGQVGWGWPCMLIWRQNVIKANQAEENCSRWQDLKRTLTCKHIRKRQGDRKSAAKKLWVKCRKKEEKIQRKALCFKDLSETGWAFSCSGSAAVRKV